MEKTALKSRIALFRRLALSLPGAVESSHMNHPDFRLNNHIFATLSGQEKGCGVLKLTLDQQAAFIADQPHIFSPVQGGWGRMGMTYLHLDQADESIMAGALKTAYHNLKEKQAQKKSPKKSQPISQPKSTHSARPAKTTRRPLQ
ncbi:MAG TPA: MmcQ/YjbR family DNA-binding protein [Edaphobacter sp.]|nr:MmcQ/YjbR family DNA-binding protein [Edaphobacter sp.]